MIDYGTINNENKDSPIVSPKSNSETDTVKNDNGGLTGMFSSFGQRIRNISGGDLERKLSADQIEKLSIGNMCAICLEEMDEENGEIFTIPICNHKFHDPCVRRWKKEKATCPSCRGVMPEELGVTDEHIWIGNHQLTIVSRPPPEPTCCYIFWTFLLTPLGLVYSISVVSLFAVFEFLLLFLFVLFFLGFAQWYAMVEYEGGLRGKICYSITSLLVFPLLVISIIFIWLHDLRILLWSLGAFCMKVMTCKCRWNDAISETVLPVIQATQGAIHSFVNQNQEQ